MLASHFSTYSLEAGCDEAGRGCLAGSVYAAAVILPEDYHNEGLNDSKQLSAHKRYRLREEIERDAIAWAIGIVTPQEIDRINILQASILAMHRALNQLKVRPEFIIVDGNKFFPYGTSRRLHAETPRRVSLLWLGPQCRLPHSSASRGNSPPWLLSLPPPKLQTTTRRRTHALLTSACTKPILLFHPL